MLTGPDGVARDDVDLGEQAGLGRTDGHDVLGDETAFQVDGARDRDGEGDHRRENTRQSDGAEDATPGSLGTLGGRRCTVASSRAPKCPTGVGDREGPSWRLSGYAAVSVHGWAVMAGTSPAWPPDRRPGQALPLTSRAASRTVRSASAACSGW